MQDRMHITKLTRAGQLSKSKRNKDSLAKFETKLCD